LDSLDPLQQLLGGHTGQPFQQATVTLKAGQYNTQIQRHSISHPRWSLPTRTTHPASRVTRSCLHTSGADELTQEEGSAAYIRSSHTPR